MSQVAVDRWPITDVVLSSCFSESSEDGLRQLSWPVVLPHQGMLP